MSVELSAMVERSQKPDCRLRMVADEEDRKKKTKGADCGGAAVIYAGQSSKTASTNPALASGTPRGREIVNLDREDAGLRWPVNESYHLIICGESLRNQWLWQVR